MNNAKNLENSPITTWKEFTRVVRSNGCKLLKRLDEFPNSILVTGCQRSGTTMLARIITQSAGMTNYWFGKDDELAAALILSGYVDHTPRGRYCFQTTYVNECYQEYYDYHGPFKIIWVLRNPYSVVYSLMYNWAPGHLQRNFDRCGFSQLYGVEKILCSVFGSRFISPVQQASLLFKAKTLQLMEMIEIMGRDKIIVVDYDDLVFNKFEILKHIYQFVGLDYRPEYCNQIHKESVGKKTKLSEKEKETVDRLAVPIYQRAQLLKSI